MARLRDKPRPSVYWPNTPTQWREPTVDDCTWYATEFAFEAASKNHISMHPVKDIRNHSSDTVGGTPLPVALRETNRIWPDSEGVTYRYGIFSRAEIRRALMDGKTLVLGGDYEKLPKHYRRWTYNDTFDHAMAARDFRVVNGVERTFLYDPLGGGPQRDFYDGEWISLDALLAFNWGSPGEAMGIVWGTKLDDEKGDKMIKGNVKRRSDKYIDLPKGTKIYDAPGGDVVRTLGNPKRFDYFGYTGGGWWAVETWIDSEAVIAYIKKDDAYERGFWPEEESPDDDVRIAELEQAITDIRAITNTAMPDDV